MEFSQLVDKMKKWIREIPLQYQGKVSVEFLAEKENFLRYIIESNNYLAEAVVEPKGFHPYRYVSFTALDKRKEVTQQDAYYYYDDVNSSCSDIFYNLNKAIQYILD
ncbi:MAG: hypothetical protein ACK5LX_02095 [Oscillospiraceae bacterium]